MRMYNQNDKKTLRIGLIMLSFVLLLLGFFVLSKPLGIIINMSKPAFDLYEVDDWSTLKKGTHVQMKLNYLHGKLYEEFLIDTGETLEEFYLLPDLQFGKDGSCNIECFMLVETEWFSPYDKLTQESKAWWTDRTGTVPFPEPTIEVNGYLEEMPGEAKGYLKRYLTEKSSVSEEEVSSFITPYVLKPYKSDEVYMQIGIALLMIIPGVLLLIVCFVLKAKERAASVSEENAGA